MGLERIITDKGQVTIPSELRKKYNLLPGKKVIFHSNKRWRADETCDDHHDFEGHARKEY